MSNSRWPLFVNSVLFGLVLLTALLEFATTPSYAQSTVSIGSVLDSNGDPATIGDPVNSAARVNCVAGCASGGGGTSSAFGAAFPANGTASGFSDGVNMQGGRVHDGDSGAGVEWNVGVILRRIANGGSVEVGTSANPLRVDPTGATTQPISAATLPLPTGAATEVTLSSRLAEATFTSRINTLGQKTMANSTPVVLPSDQSAIPVTPTTVSLTTTGQQAVTAVAAALPSNVAKEVCIRTLSSGTQTVFYGPAGVTTATGQELLPGDKHCAPVSNSNQFTVIAGGVGSSVAFEVYN